MDKPEFEECDLRGLRTRVTIPKVLSSLVSESAGLRGWPFPLPTLPRFLCVGDAGPDMGGGDVIFIENDEFFADGGYEASVSGRWAVFHGFSLASRDFEDLEADYIVCGGSVFLRKESKKLVREKWEKWYGPQAGSMEAAKFKVEMINNITCWCRAF